MLPINTLASRRALARWATGVTGLPFHQWGADLPRPAAGVAPSAYVSLLRLEGPAPVSSWSRDLQVEVIEAATIVIQPGAELVGGYVSVLVNNRRISRETPAATTVEAVRDAFLALLDAELEMPATFAAAGTDTIEVTPVEFGALRCLTSVGDVEITPTLVEATVSTGTVESRVRIAVHQPAGPTVMGAGPDSYGAALLIDLKQHTSKALLQSWGVVPDGRGRELAVTIIRDGGGSEIRAFFDLFYSEIGWTAAPANALTGVSELEGEIVDQEMFFNA